MLVSPSLVSFIVVHVETGPIKKTPTYYLGAAPEPTTTASAASLIMAIVVSLDLLLSSQPLILPCTHIPPFSPLRGRPIRLLGPGSPLPHPNEVRDIDFARCLKPQ